MKKKILAMCLIVCLLAVAVVGGTLAYFTDTDDAQNVMTTGKVDISQLEQQRDAEGNLVDFVQDKPLMPMVDKRADKNANPVVNGYFDSGMKNVVDKVITVKNEAPAGAINQDAYVRTIIAFETATEYEEGTNTVRRDGKKIFSDYIGVLKGSGFQWLERGTVTVEGVEYVLGVLVYENALVPQEVSAPSLKQVFLSPEANNEVALLFGDEYTILAVSQAAQTAGFDTAAEALDEAFGNLSDPTHAKYVDDAKLVEWLSAAVNG